MGRTSTFTDTSTKLIKNYFNNSGCKPLLDIYIRSSNPHYSSRPFFSKYLKLQITFLTSQIRIKKLHYPYKADQILSVYN